MNRAFSLVELSIVLVILGLLTGGILAGQSLIRASELRAFSSELQRYQAAIGAFRDKYFQLPGDMNSATKFWGAAHATPATCKITSSTTTTCDGDGNGFVQNGATGSYEPFRFWQHLALAGLVEGSYTGVGASGGVDHALPGTNVPASKLDKAGFFPIAEGFAYSADTYRYDGDYKNYFRIGTNDGGGWVNSVFIRPEELWNVDTKLDDGKPAYGMVRAWKSTYSPNCTTTDISSTAAYALSQTGKTCGAIFLTGY